MGMDCEEFKTASAAAAWATSDGRNCAGPWNVVEAALVQQKRVTAAVCVRRWNEVIPDTTAAGAGRSSTRRFSQRDQASQIQYELGVPLAAI
jgi:hypothetical protein